MFKTSFSENRLSSRLGSAQTRLARGKFIKSNIIRRLEFGIIDANFEPTGPTPISRSQRRAWAHRISSFPLFKSGNSLVTERTSEASLSFSQPIPRVMLALQTAASSPFR